jgi:16S rRNA (guanine966-N2)-methyltransferase
VRIVGGRLRGRTLLSPESRDIRPTSDRLRESLFNILQHGYDDPVSGGRVVDVFAGTGALGLEAVSRGARHALFVDNGAEARALIRGNVEALGLGGVTRIFRRDARQLGACVDEPYTLAFLDPPYGQGHVAPTLATLRDGKWLAADALAIVEEAADTLAPDVAGYALLDTRLFGQTRIDILRLSAVA